MRFIGLVEMFTRRRTDITGNGLAGCLIALLLLIVFWAAIIAAVIYRP
jgi:hypothetical protein